jgi:hypothetical protein
MLKLLIPKIEISNFSGLQFPNQFVLLGKASHNRRVNFYDIRNFSSGEKTLFYILLFINYVRQIGLLIIDEPENHFHEDLLMRFCKLLNDVGEADSYVDLIFKVAEDVDEPIKEKYRSRFEDFYEGYNLAQIYLLSHSKNLIYNNFSLGINYIVEDQFTRIDYDNYEKTLRRIGVSSIYSKVLFVEGDTEEQYLEMFLSDFNIKVHPLQGSSQVLDTFRRVCKIKEYLRESHFCFLLDMDTMSNDEIEAIREEAPEYFDQTFIILDKHEFENFLLDEKIFHEIIKRHSGLFGSIGLKSLDEVEAEIKAIADNTKDLLYRKELQKLNGNSISKLKRFFRRRDLPVEDEGEYNEYIRTKMSEANVSEFLSEEFRNNYLFVSQKYTDENWNENWKKLCDGKAVLGQVVRHFSDYLDLRSDRLRKEIKEIVSKSSQYEINQLIESILNKFDDNGA